MELFAKVPDKILAQIGLVSLSPRYWQDYEPGTPSPGERIENIERLEEIGILPEVRIDPMIPFVTDTELHIRGLFDRLKEVGVERATVSYLHLRPAIYSQLMQELSPLHRKLIESFFRTQEWKEIGSSTKTKLLPKIIREKGYHRVKEIGKMVGIKVAVCQCKNPDLEGDLCGSGRVKAVLRKKPTLTQLPLFRC